MHALLNFISQYYFVYRSNYLEVSVSDDVVVVAYSKVLGVLASIRVLRFSVHDGEF
jgi:hypothetical protein